MGKYKNLVFGIILSVLSGAISVTGYHSLNHFTPQLAVRVIGPTAVNVGDTPEYRVDVQNLSWWAQKPSLQWDISEINSGKVTPLTLADGGIGFGVPANASQYHIVVAGSTYYNYFVWGKQSTLGIFPLDVVVNNPNPPAPPSPNPTPVPEPTVPDGKYKIASISYKLFIQVPYSDRPTLAKAIAGNYSAVSAAIRAGALSTLNDVFQTVKSKNTATITSLKLSPASLTPWTSAISAKIEEDYNSKQLTKLSDFADFFDEVVQGLSYVK